MQIQDQERRDPRLGTAQEVQAQKSVSANLQILESSLNSLHCWPEGGPGAASEALDGMPILPALSELPLRSCTASRTAVVSTEIITAPSSCWTDRVMCENSFGDVADNLLCCAAD